MVHTIVVLVAVSIFALLDMRCSAVHRWWHQALRLRTFAFFIFMDACPGVDHSRDNFTYSVTNKIVIFVPR